MLVWNRVAYVKHPLTGKRLARINPKEKWEIKPVSHLRIIEDDLWQKVKARQGEVRTEMTSNKSNPLNGARRRQFLLSGLLTCGECGGNYIIVGKDYYRCSQHRHKNTCGNCLSISRRQIEGRVLAGLQTKLMAPEMVEEFSRTYHEEINRTAHESGRQRKLDEKQLTELRRKIGSVLSAIEDGAYSNSLKSRLEQLEAEKLAL